MFEERLRELGNKINFVPFTDDNPGMKDYKYYIVTNKETNREVYFRNIKEAKDFIEFKFNGSLKKKLAYFLIKIGVLPFFLKKINLHPSFGDVIFIGGQIKCFDLKNKTVMSLPLHDSEMEWFIERKKFQITLPKEYSPQLLKDFSGEIIHVGKEKNYVFTREELLKKYEGRDYLKIFKKLYSFYEKNGITKNKDGLLTVKTHGAFSKEQILVREFSCPFNSTYHEEDIVFTDWESKQDLITRDLYEFFKMDKIGNKEFEDILKIYPKEVQDNISKYLRLNSEALKNEQENYKNKYGEKK
jgi:hypothetical protein